MNSEKGFALVLSMVMLLAMTLMGSVLLMNATSQSKVTGTSETTRQTFLSAETGIEAARRWLTREFEAKSCLLYTSPSPRDLSTSRMPSSA